MKIAWFTPLHERSAIGRFSEGVTTALAELGVEIELWRSDTGPIHPVQLPVRTFIPDAETAIKLERDYDLCIYNFGNYLPYHASIFEMSQRQAGLAILHDLTLHHFFASLYLERMHSPQAYSEALIRLYPELKERFHSPQALAAAQLWSGEEVTRYPFFDPVLENALGVVCHSRFHASAVERRWPGPIQFLPLAYEPKHELRKMPMLNTQPSSPHPNLLIVGHINPNKCVHLLFEALRNLQPVEVICAGPIEGPYRARLEAIYSKLGIEGKLTFTGYISDHDLAEYYSVADLCINLRKPITEGASASIIEQMFLGKASLVFSEGFYGELPEETVFRCRPANLQMKLAEALKSREVRDRVGRAAKLHAEATFTYSAYAEQMRRRMSDVLESRPLLELTQHLGEELNFWGISRKDPIVARLSAIVGELFQRDH